MILIENKKKIHIDLLENQRFASFLFGFDLMSTSMTFLDVQLGT